MRTALIALGLVGFVFVASALSGGDSPAPPPTEEARPRTDLRQLEQVYGPGHPQVLAAKAKLAAADEPTFKGTVLVLTRAGNTSTSLRDARNVTLGGRSFLVGTEVKNNYTTGQFNGKKVWIPVDEVTELVELGEAAPEKK
jgi:hypothetical protein